MTDIDFKKILRHSPYYERLEPHSQTRNWMAWNGYKTPRVLDQLASEYFAIRSACSIMDLTPMEKYRITGPDAADYLNRLVTRDVSRLKPGRVTYVVWCNDEGDVIDDGTIFHLSEGVYRLCAQHHQLDWLMLSAIGFDVSIEKEADDVAALAVQGPTSFAVLSAAGVNSLDGLKPFGIQHTKCGGVDVTVSRTGFTGDLGYELWTAPENAHALWDAIFSVKERGLYDVKVIGLDALEMVRIEAGFLMPGWDFNTADTIVRAGRGRSPFELGLEWIVDLKKPYFTGKKALTQEKARRPERRLLKLVIEGNKSPANSFLFDRKNGRNIGAVMSTIWSPILKSNLAFADVRYKNGQPPAEIWAEIYYQKELQWNVSWARGRIEEKAFWSPERRTATPPAWTQ
ncbi:MAG: aminomethyltransferase family protein [Pseudomonadota bacterium]